MQSCVDAKIHRCTNVQVLRCNNAQYIIISFPAWEWDSAIECSLLCQVNANFILDTASIDTTWVLLMRRSPAWIECWNSLRQDLHLFILELLSSKVWADFDLRSTLGAVMHWNLVIMMSNFRNHAGRVRVGFHKIYVTCYSVLLFTLYYLPFKRVAALARWGTRWMCLATSDQHHIAPARMQATLENGRSIRCISLATRLVIFRPQGAQGRFARNSSSRKSVPSRKETVRSSNGASSACPAMWQGSGVQVIVRKFSQVPSASRNGLMKMCARSFDQE